MTVLSPNQFAVLRQAATEPPGYSEGIEGELEFELKKDLKTKYPQSGAYLCVACSMPLYYARHKFNSGCVRRMRSTLQRSPSAVTLARCHAWPTGCQINTDFAWQGWPAFYDGVPGAIEERPDEDGMRSESIVPPAPDRWP